MLSGALMCVSYADPYLGKLSGPPQNLYLLTLASYGTESEGRLTKIMDCKCCPPRSFSYTVMRVKQDELPKGPCGALRV